MLLKVHLSSWDMLLKLLVAMLNVDLSLIWYLV